MNITGLICGLGNPGRRHQATRHNAGFMVIDHIIQSSLDISEETVKLRIDTCSLIIWEWMNLNDSSMWLLLKPLTYMNRSGLAVAKTLANSNIDIHNLLIIHDEVDLNLGQIRLKFGGGLAGHNGLRSIAGELGTRDFARLRFGVGRPDDGNDLARYVLNNFRPDEQQLRDDIITRSARIVRVFRQEGLQKARDFLSANP
ncbi:aminoacyl-tRNA hydrolase [Desulfonatronovibrio magnus]|uniref:aminoacyl-tRNA hydrolase n=1 Tax=Desulfonatronovibrio magnus TaxID=698827 RepID=UPI0005EBD0BC|nr:aminoacyl-tRNA hydrolase [Desulfonatronovibrio magnus]